MNHQISIYCIPGLAEKYPLNAGIPVPSKTSTKQSFEVYYRNVLEKVCSEFGVNPDRVINSKRRFRELVLSRQLAMAVIMEHQRGSLSEISSFFKQTHVMVLYSVKTVHNLITTDRVFRDRVGKFFN